jgi:hypothetical protein
LKWGEIKETVIEGTWITKAECMVANTRKEASTRKANIKDLIKSN